MEIKKAVSEGVYLDYVVKDGQFYVTFMSTVREDMDKVYLYNMPYQCTNNNTTIQQYNNIPYNTMSYHTIPYHSYYIPLAPNLSSINIEQIKSSVLRR
jgi:hypothetical protein